MLHHLDEVIVIYMMSFWIWTMPHQQAAVYESAGDGVPSPHPFVI